MLNAVPFRTDHRDVIGDIDGNGHSDFDGIC